MRELLHALVPCTTGLCYHAGAKVVFVQRRIPLRSGFEKNKNLNYGQEEKKVGRKVVPRFHTLLDDVQGLDLKHSPSRVSKMYTNSFEPILTAP